MGDMSVFCIHIFSMILKLLQNILCICVCVYMCLCVYICVYIYIHRHTHTHTVQAIKYSKKTLCLFVLHTYKTFLQKTNTHLIPKTIILNSTIIASQMITFLDMIIINSRYYQMVQMLSLLVMPLGNFYIGQAISARGTMRAGRAIWN